MFSFSEPIAPQRVPEKFDIDDDQSESKDGFRAKPANTLYFRLTYKINKASWMDKFSNQSMRTLSMRNARASPYSNPMSSDEKILLDNVSEVVESGKMLAILGPSGAGKTTLLRILTMKAFGGNATGVISVNGKPMTTDLFKQKCGIVEQEDHHWSFLTCEETIAYAADLFLPHLSAAERAREVDNMIHKMGLAVCRKTIVGNSFVHGLSGGQKRRLSLAVAFMKKLDILFLDEPTSGLDAASAAGIVEFISSITKKEHIITIFTIHQPSTSSFNTFDRVMLLSRGRIAYCGGAADVPRYLESINHPLPAYTNPAEYLLDIVNMDFSDEAHVELILKEWGKLGDPGHQERIQTLLANCNQTNSLTKPTPPNSSVQVESSRMNIIHQTMIMLRRHFQLSYRDPMIYTGRMLLFFISTLFFAIVYIDARFRTQDQALNREWFINWCIGVPSNMGVIAVYVYNYELQSIKREVKNGMIESSSYLISNSILQIPVMFLFGLSVLPVSQYAIMRFQADHFGQMLLIYAFTMYSFEAVAQLLAVVFANPLLGMLQYVNLWFCSFLFCGLFLPIQNIVWPLRVFSYIMPFRYAFQLMAYQEFTGSTFANSEPCEYGVDPACHPLGYKCDSDVPICYGHTGEQILINIHQNFAVINSNDNFSNYVSVLVAIALGCKIGFIVMMTIRAREESTLHSDDRDTNYKISDV